MSVSVPRLPPLPTEVFADPGRNDWYFRGRKPDSVARFVRDDQPPTLEAAMALPEIAALVEVLAATTIILAEHEPYPLPVLHKALEALKAAGKLPA